MRSASDLSGPRAEKAGGDTFSTVMPWRRVMRRARFKNRRGCLGPGACDPSGISDGGQFPGQAGSLRLYTRPEPFIGPQRASLRAHRHGSTHHEHDRKRIAARSFHRIVHHPGIVLAAQSCCSRPAGPIDLVLRSTAITTVCREAPSAVLATIGSTCLRLGMSTRTRNVPSACTLTGSPCKVR